MDDVFEEKENQITTHDVIDALDILNANMTKEFDSLRAELQKPRKTFWFWISFIMFAYAVLCLFIGFIILIADGGSQKIDENNTVEITATVDKIQPIPYQIRFKEHNAVFIIQNQYIVVDMDELGSLSVGQTVVFRILEEDFARTTNFSNTINFVELKASSDIITLKSYNDYYGYDDFSVFPSIILFVFGVVFLIPAILCFRKYRRINLVKNQIDRKKHLDI